MTKKAIVKKPKAKRTTLRLNDRKRKLEKEDFELLTEFSQMLKGYAAHAEWPQLFVTLDEVQTYFGDIQDMIFEMGYQLRGIKVVRYKP